MSCRYCHESLPSEAESLLSHFKTCTAVYRPDSSFRFVCCVCDYKTYHISNMRAHIRSHLREKPFKCPYCSYCAALKQHIQVHVRIKHWLILSQVIFTRKNNQFHWITKVLNYCTGVDDPKNPEQLANDPWMVN